MSELPLAGRAVVVTRARAQAGEFAALLRGLGAEVIHLPLIRIERPADQGPLRAAARGAGGFDWIVFTSANGVSAFQAALRGVGGELATLERPSVCAIGPGTARALEDLGRSPELVPAEHVAEAVVETLAAATDLRGLRILLPRAEVARAALPEMLEARGAAVEDVPAYRTVAEDEGADTVRERIAAGGVDVLTFTSGSTVRRFVERFGAAHGSALVATIGPVTSAAARELGLAVDIEARDYTVDGLVAALVQHYAGGGG